MQAGPLAQPLVDQAWQRFAQGDLPGAIALAREASQADAPPPSASAALGYFLIQAGMPDEAGQVLLPARERTPGYAPLHWYTGYLLQGRGDKAGAAQAFERACTLDASLDEAAFALAWILHDLGRIDEAAEWAGRGLGTRRMPERLLQVGWLQQQRGLHEDAAASYHEAIAALGPSAPGHARLHLHLGQCLAQLGRGDDAMRTLETGLRAHPDDAELLLAYGVVLREQGLAAEAAQAARRLTTADSGDVRGWDLLALAQEDLGDLAAAASAIDHSLALQPMRAGHLSRLAALRRREGRMDDAMRLVGLALEAEPDHMASCELRVHLLLDKRDHAAARRSLLPMLRQAPIHAAEGLRLLAVTASLRGRRRAARRWLMRSTRLAEDRAETWRTLAWVEAELGNVRSAVQAVKRLLALAPDDTAAQLQGALILSRGGEVHAAERLAEQLLATKPGQADAWRALAEVRYFQRRWSESQWAIEQALTLQPDGPQHWRRLAWACMEQGEYARARAAFEQARALQPEEHDILIEMAELAVRSGEGRAAVALLEGGHAEGPVAQLLRARLLIEGGQSDAGDPAAAIDICRDLLARKPDDSVVLQIVARALSLGHSGAAEVLDAADQPSRLAALRHEATSAVHLHAHADLGRLLEYARQREPADGWLQCAGLYFAWMDARSTPRLLASRAREWSAALRNEPLPLRGAPGARGQAVPAVLRGSRPRLAYLATQPHQCLLRRVLAAHGHGEVDVLLFSDGNWPDLPSNVQLRPIELDRLAATCAANAVEVVIDTGGLHPLGSLEPDQGQYGLLRVLGERIAPCQVGWLGTWGTSGNLFDVLLADAWSVPPEHRGGYSETVEWIEGGQWCWDPPPAAPAVTDLPALRTGELALGVIARHVRLNDESVLAMAQVLQRLPCSRLVLLGRMSDDWPARRRLLGLLESAGIASDRVQFEPHRTHAHFLETLQRLDLVLDTFPGSGGLSLLDALWMGVPVVTLAGLWSGARQGASLVMTVGQPEWVAHTVESYVQTAVQLGQDLSDLAAIRLGLREQVQRSPLLDGVRVARQIEALARRMQVRG